MKRILLLMFIVTVCISCEKKSELNLSEIKPDPDKEFLKNIKSDEKSEYFISGEFDGYPIYCASTFVDIYPNNSTTLNAMYINKSISLDNIHLLRFNKSQDVWIAFYFSHANILNQNIPYTLPHPGQVLGENISIELLNLKKAGSVMQNSPKDNYSFHSNSFNGFKLVVTNFKDYIIEGVFEGIINTNTGSRIMVKNGKFRIKIQLVDLNNPIIG